MAETTCFIDGQLDHLLGAWRQADLSNGRPVAAPDDKLHRAAHAVQLHTEIGEHFRCDTLTLAHQPEQQVLRADVVMIKAGCLLLREGQHLSRPLGELVEPLVHGLLSSLVPVALALDRSGARYLRAPVPGLLVAYRTAPVLRPGQFLGAVCFGWQLATLQHCLNAGRRILHLPQTEPQTPPG